MIDIEQHIDHANDRIVLRVTYGRQDWQAVIEAARRGDVPNYHFLHTTLDKGEE